MYNLTKKTIKEVKSYSINYINKCLIIFNDLNLNELDQEDVIYYEVLKKQYNKKKKGIKKHE